MKYSKRIIYILVLLILVFTCFYFIQYNSNTLSKKEHITAVSTNQPSITASINQTAATKPSIIDSANSQDTVSSPIKQIVQEDIPMEDRVIYQPGFYYESLSENVKSRITGISYAENCTIPYEELRYVSVTHFDFDGQEQIGELICNQAIAQDLVEILYALYQAEYPIEQIRLIDEYNGDDTLSMLDNNTSCFNYRVIEGTTTLSKHALGMAIDINPFYNPYVTYPDGIEHISPKGSEPYADRDAEFSFKISHDDLACKLFMEHGFKWGGDWKTVKDYQHFQKE